MCRHARETLGKLIAFANQHFGTFEQWNVTYFYLSALRNNGMQHHFIYQHFGTLILALRAIHVNWHARETLGIMLGFSYRHFEIKSGKANGYGA